MDKENTILTELYQISPVVAKIGDANVFTPPPAGFFESLPGLILNRIKAEQTVDAADELNIISPLLANIDKKNPYNIPDGYFEELPSGLIAGAKAIDLVNEEPGDLHSALIDAVRDVNVYRVPDNYFKELPGRMLSLVENREPAKLVSIGLPRKLARYAAAAVVGGILLIGGITYLNRDTVKESGQTLASIEKVGDSETAFNKISDAEMSTYLENEPFYITDAAYSASDDITGDDLMEMLHDVPDETLQQYLALYSDVKPVSVN